MWNSVFHRSTSVWMTYMCWISSARFVPNPRNCFPFLLNPFTKFPVQAKILSCGVPANQIQKQLFKNLKRSWNVWNFSSDTARNFDFNVWLSPMVPPSLTPFMGELPGKVRKTTLISPFLTWKTCRTPSLSPTTTWKNKLESIKNSAKRIIWPVGHSH